MQTASSFYDFEGEKRAATASTSYVSDTRSKNSWSGLPFCLTPIRTDQSPPVTGTGMAEAILWSPEKLCDVSARKTRQNAQMLSLQGKGNEAESLDGL